MRIDEVLIEECGMPAFDEVRSRVVASVGARADFWESGQNVDELLTRLRGSMDIAALMKAFDPSD